MREDEKKFIELLKERPVQKKNLCKTASYFVNCFCINTEEMVAEIAADAEAKELMDEIAWHWIHRAYIQSQNKWNYDDRNKIAYEICRDLCETPKGEEIIRLSSDKKCVGYEVALYMASEHRTLQQTFTGFVFTYLTTTNERFQEISKEAGHPDVKRLPLI